MASKLRSSGEAFVASFICTRESLLASVRTHVMSQLEFLGKCLSTPFPCTLDRTMLLKFPCYDAIIPTLNVGSPCVFS